MRQIVRISVFILAVLLTINFFFNAVIANSYMLMILLIDLLMIFLLIFFPRKLCLTPKCIIILYLWIFVRQFYYSGFSFGQLPVLIYHCAAPIVTFTLISIISEDNRSFSIRFGKLAHHDFGKLDITYILIAAWCLIFVISLEHQRNLQNWGYANYIYLVYALFPLVFISEKKHLKWALFFLLVIATLVSKKRTAILLLVSYIAIIVFRAFSKKRIKKFQLVLVLFASFIGFFIK